MVPRRIVALPGLAGLLVACLSCTHAAPAAGPTPKPEIPHASPVEIPPEIAPEIPIGLSVGRRAPDFAATDVDGVEFKLSDYRGKVVVIDFWGFW